MRDMAGSSMLYGHWSDGAPRRITDVRRTFDLPGSWQASAALL